MIENATPPPVPKEDNLAADLVNMLSKVGITDMKTQNALLMKLVPYLVDRDHKILMHGIDTGRANA